MYEIEKGIEVPNYERYRKYPFEGMEIGDSFLVPHEMKNRVQASASSYGRRKNKRFLTRTVESGVRVWRVE